MYMFGIIFSCGFVATGWCMLDQLKRNDRADMPNVGVLSTSLD